MTRQLYTKNHRMSDLICENYNLLLVMSRFGLSLGFGDKTVKEVCEEHKVDTNTFLAVANFMEKECYTEENYNGKISIESLMNYLQQAHSYFLDFNLPVIRRKLIEALDCSKNDVSFLILKYYDEYVNEVRTHMEYENNVVFKYVSSLLKGEETSSNYNISVFAKKHNQIEAKLTEFKNIIVKYYPSNQCNNLLNSVLFDIYSSEEDLYAHCRVEDYIFVPIIRELEKNKRNGDK